MKRLVLCCDGTWNRADQEKNGTPCPTNVVKLAYRVAKRDPAGVPQLIFYDQGVGTGNAVDRLTGGAFGEGIVDNILDAYRFLIANYEPGDEVFLFGFSRGAFTARSIAGLIRKCGVLKRTAVGRYAEAGALYRRSDVHPDDDEAATFRKAHSCCGSDPIKIRFIGVWDTVGALGIPLRGLRWLTLRDHTFHDTELSGSVQEAYHALSIDERRAPFEPTVWKPKDKPDQTVEQVWFAGVHSDVGGGYAREEPEPLLSDIPLAWMLGKAEDAGLALDAEVMQQTLTIAPTAEQHESKRGLYRLADGYDRPIGFWKDEKDRLVPDETQKVHESVLARWDADPEYRPPQLRAWFRRYGDARGDAP